MTIKIVLVILAAIIIMIFLTYTKNKQKYEIKNQQKKHIKNTDLIKNPICPWCETGRASLKLDESSPMCPYIGSLKDGECPFYKPVE